jgi:hypothetical protein
MVLFDGYGKLHVPFWKAIYHAFSSFGRFFAFLGYRPCTSRTCEIYKFLYFLVQNYSNVYRTCENHFNV